MNEELKQQLHAIETLKILVSGKYEDWYKIEIEDMIRYVGKTKYNLYIIVHKVNLDKPLGEKKEYDTLFIDIDDNEKRYFRKGVSQLIKNGTMFISNE